MNDKPGVQDDKVIGQRCSQCNAVVTQIVADDVRVQWEKDKHPLSEEDKTMLWCSCNHPRDC